MSVADLPPAIQVHTRAERLQLVREIITSLEIEEELLEEFPIKPSSDLLALAGIAKGDVQVHARDDAEDAARLETLV